MVALSRKHIVRACKVRGWTIQPVALERIENYLEKSAHDHDANTSLQRILESMSIEMKNQNLRTITDQLLDMVLDDSEDDYDAPMTRNKSATILDVKKRQSRMPLKDKKNQFGDSFSDFQVVNAFETPRLVYDVLRRQFRVDEKRWKIFGSAEDKVRFGSNCFPIDNLLLPFIPITIPCLNDAISFFSHFLLR